MLVAGNVCLHAHAAQTSTSTEEGGFTTDKQIFQLKVTGLLATTISGWMVATFGTTWTLSALTPLAIAGLVGILASQITGILALVPPSVKQREDIALLSGVHTTQQVDVLQKLTPPGATPTPEVIKAVQAIAPDPGPTPEVMARVDADIKRGEIPHTTTYVDVTKGATP